MKKYFCDICKKETDRLYECVVPVEELKKVTNSKGAVVTAIWGVGTSSIDMCRECANRYVTLHSTLSNYPRDTVYVCIDLAGNFLEDANGAE